MAKSDALELDFFRMEKEAGKQQQLIRSFRDIQGVISKIVNPDVLKSVIPQICDPSCCDNAESSVAPITIFYNGITAVFHVSPLKAKEILKVAEEGILIPKSNSYAKQNLLEPLTLNGGARRKSLQRFLEKRTERLTMVSPYDRPPTNYTYYGQSTCTNNIY